MKIAFHTLGCKVNQYETESLREQFLGEGYEIVGENDHADVYVINTCTVTGLADRKSRQYIRRMKKLNPDSLIVVTGCYVQISPDDVADIPQVDIIAGTNEKHKIPGYVRDFDPAASNRHVLERDDLSEYEETGPVTSMESRTRAYIKIEEGCDRFCSYCVIPYARGPVRCRDEKDILEEAEKLVGSGFRELILTGINTALYSDLPGLLDKLDRMEGDFRVRLSSLEPTVADKSFIEELFRSKRLCHHLHLSMQSGSDRILKAMDRPYSREQYFEIVDTIRDFDPLYGITTDMIAGFPGETEEDHQMSLEAVERSGFGKVHAFRFSARPGTKAERMKDQTDPSEKKKRLGELMDRGSAAAEDFLKKNIGTKARVLFESSDRNEGYISGYSDNYIKVYADDGCTPENGFADVLIEELYKDGVYGKVV
ncbi:MAG: tRNA (N(6)-L-threonylcarbamoyladenosine(37)-C(2))-methylthiotransferase MtaB [Eubacteriaceae bacterium]|nr:tRNA (N(6)-L-threonylcarbamoyladenosine(37)-C(2))-methylthiotransferase MtaB [Eubacteriaceae bacterium]